ncbi:hypothetical protein CFP65_2900 [Kitasatospora sp. MMS16-BH015]|uniref:serine/threonine-protein kinase n=1 Tax=Kitasatospora sp. MMS16-BH015 TaxID=2018025 RepID=UPI000CA1C666|nr:serine/threonine-protein kinase [Kitasatospora sp. MMS16-BH015]AUG77711.1 hypothetical protein CFP65_2900 [Kitasatospora sp. MMS16-BH015]
MTQAQGSTSRLLAGRYRLDEVLGRGGMGTVWRAEDEMLGRIVAVKELRMHGGVDEEEKHRLIVRTLREAKATARIRHTAAVTVFDVVEEDDRPWIVMELVESRSLAEVIKEDGPLSPARAAEIALEVLGVLGAAHSHGILHRDVKPSNVLIGEDGRVVLTDFGIASVEGDTSVTSTGMLVGAPSYISPERARGQKPGPPADLWSLGGTLYSMVEGRPPYDRGSALATLTAVMTEELETPKNAGPLRPVIEGLLEKDPAKRLDASTTRSMLRRVVGEAIARAESTTQMTTPPAADAAAPATEKAEKAEKTGRSGKARGVSGLLGTVRVGSRAAADAELGKGGAAGAVGAVGAAGTAAAGAGAAGAAVGGGLPVAPSAGHGVPGARSGGGSGTGSAGSGGAGGTGAAGAGGSGAAGGGWSSSEVLGEPRPAAGGRGGVRRPVVIGAAVLALVVLIAVLVVLLRNGKDTAGSTSGAAATAVVHTSAAGTPTPAKAVTSAPASPPAAPPATATTPSAAASPATTPSSAAPSTTPSSAAPTTAALPAGFHLYQDGSGFKIALPDSVQPAGSGANYRTFQGQNGTTLRVEWTDKPGPSALAAWQEQEQGTSFTGYQRVKLVAAPYRSWTNAADWEFTFTGTKGGTMHALDRGFVTGKYGYAIYWTMLDSEWNSPEGATIRQVSYDSFQPAG